MLRLLTRTVDVDGDGLEQLEAIGTLESRDLSEGLDSTVLSTGVGISLGLSLDQLKVEVVVLGSDQDREGATVLLSNRLVKKKQSWAR